MGVAEGYQKALTGGPQMSLMRRDNDIPGKRTAQVKAWEFKD